MSSRARSTRILAVAREPRWVAALALALLFAAGCIGLGQWQWSRTYDIVEAERAAQSAPVDVASVTAVGAEVAGGDIGRSVTASGTYDPAGQVAIEHRLSDGREGVWLWTPLVLDDGSRVGVVRGWASAPDDPAAVPPAGPVAVTGVLHPDEGFYADAPVEGGTALAIDSLRLGGNGARGGFVMLRGEDPAPALAPAQVPQTIVTADVPFPVRNFLYSFQWWIFGAFGIAAWGVLLWREARDRRADLPVR